MATKNALASFGAAYNFVIRAMAVVAGATVCAIVAMVAYDVVARDVGLPILSGTVAFTEYGLLLVTMLAGPFLVRERAHVTVEIVTRALSPNTLRIVERLICVICLGGCLLFVVYGVQNFITAISYGD